MKLDVVHCIIVLHSPPMLYFLVCVRIIVRRVDDGTNDNLLVSGGNQNIDNEPASTSLYKKECFVSRTLAQTIRYNFNPGKVRFFHTVEPKVVFY